MSQCSLANGIYYSMGDKPTGQIGLDRPDWLAKYKAGRARNTRRTVTGTVGQQVPLSAEQLLSFS